MFEVQFNDKFTFYLDRWELVIHVIDDAAPLSPDEWDPVDEIGTAKIPLRNLMLDEKWIDNWFPILNKNGDHCGIIDIEIVMTENLQSNIVAQSKYGMAINEQWEKDFIEALCIGIVKSTTIWDVDSIFYMFSKNEETISQEKFKNAVLSAKAGHNMWEIDIFIKSTELFNKGRTEKISRKEFYTFF